MFKVIFNKIPTTRPLPDSSSLRKSFSRRQRLARDERGITLQTLIVTAVLVLVAVAAGVILVAISRSQESSLTDSGKSDPGEGTCEPWEINDIELKAKGLGGPQGYGGFYSSAIGCVRVCYVQSVGGGNTQISSTTRIIPAGQAHSWSDAYQLVLGFSLSDQRIRPATADGAGLFPSFQVVSSTEVGNLPEPGSATVRSAVRNVDAATQARGLLTVADENQEIRVHPSQEFCHLVDTANDDEEITRSDIAISGQTRQFIHDQ